MEKTVVSVRVMGFYHKDGLVPAWKQAIQFAGKDGRLGILPEVIDARLATKPDDVPWETYFTTLTAEYMGLSKMGNKIIIVAHGIGPMATLDGILKVYSHEFKDKDRNRRGGRISHQEFLDLEAGKYGDVQVLDFNEVLKRYKYPFSEILTESKALAEPLLRARLGSRAEEYIKAHAKFAREWHLEQSGVSPENRYNLPDWDQHLDRRASQHLQDGRESSDPHIIQMGCTSNCCYEFQPLEEGMAFAHLVSIGGLCHLCHDGKESLVGDINCHEWTNGVRLLAIQKDAKIINIHRGANAYKLLRKYWKLLMRPAQEEIQIGFCHILSIGDQWFTDYLKKGARMDNWEPEFLVTSMTSVGDPKEFTTTIGGYHGFFKYGINEVRAIAPSEANAYFSVSELEIIWRNGNPKEHKVLVQFYRIEADTSQRLMRSNELCCDYETLMDLTAREEKEIA